MNVPNDLKTRVQRYLVSKNMLAIDEHGFPIQEDHEGTLYTDLLEGFVLSDLHIPSKAEEQARRLVRESLADENGVSFHVRHPNDCRAWMQESCSCRAKERYDDLMKAIAMLSENPSVDQSPIKKLSLTDILFIAEKAAQHRMHDGKPGADGCADEFGDGARYALEYMCKKGYAIYE